MEAADRLRERQDHIPESPRKRVEMGSSWWDKFEHLELLAKYPDQSFHLYKRVHVNVHVHCANSWPGGVNTLTLHTELSVEFERVRGKTSARNSEVARQHAEELKSSNLPIGVSSTDNPVLDAGSWEVG
eukprot:3734627-Amphidinium_carterae.2